MYWHIRQDFICLFKRDENNKDHFPAIDGLRAIANILIVSCHLVTIFSALVPSHPSIEWQQYLTSIAFKWLPLSGFALEIFFMLSGFLLTYKLIVQWNSNPNRHGLFLKQYPNLILKRAFRFWPGMVLPTTIMFILGDAQYLNSSYYLELSRLLSVWLFCQNYVDIDYYFATLAPLWSISLDMQVHIILSLLIYVFYSYKKYISMYYSLGILLIISIIQGYVTFNPRTMPLTSLVTRYHYLSLTVSPHISQWLQRHYNVTFSYEVLQINPMKLFIHKMYLPLEAHFGSFIIGSMLAIKVINSSHDVGKPSMLKYVFLGLTIWYMVLLGTGDTDAKNVSDNQFKLVMAVSRQIFTFGQAFILFTALSSPSHPYHFHWMNKFLSLSIWIPISKLSYLLYMIHWRISLELIFGGPLFFLKSYSFTYAILFSLPIILLVSEIVSGIWYLFVEKIMERVIHSYFSERKFRRKHAQ